MAVLGCAHLSAGWAQKSAHSSQPETGILADYFSIARNTSSDVQRSCGSDCLSIFADRLGRLESCWRKSYGKPKCRLSYPQRLAGNQGVLRRSDTAWHFQ